MTTGKKRVLVDHPVTQPTNEGQHGQLETHKTSNQYLVHIWDLVHPLALYNVHVLPYQRKQTCVKFVHTQGMKAVCMYAEASWGLSGWIITNLRW